MKTKAVVEVVGVFAVVWGILALVGLSPLGEWERETAGRFSFIEYSLLIALTLLVMVVTRKGMTSYGVSFRNLRYHLDVAATAFLPVALGFVPIAFIGDGHKTWWGSLIMSGALIIELLLLAWILRRKPTRNETVVVGALLLLTAANLTQRAPLDTPVTGFIFFIFFLGFGEEHAEFKGFGLARLQRSVVKGAGGHSELGR